MREVVRNSRTNMSLKRKEATSACALKPNAEIQEIEDPKKEVRR